MEILVILLFLVLIVLVLSFQHKALQRIGYLEEEIFRLRKELERAPAAEHVIAQTASRAEQVSQQAPAHGPAAPATHPDKAPPAPISKPSTQSEPAPGFFERHPDLEKFIGENLISKIGIAILVLAIGFFVKYAIDNDWIGPIGRVGVGLICGGILIGVAHVLRKSYKAFSSVLVGGGLAVFYFTIALAYHQYQLFGQSTAFIIMLVITAFAVILSLLYDRQELAVIALVGGFVAPFLAGNGSGNYKILFSYLLILNTGLLVIAYHKSWRLLNLLAFLFTSLLFVSWVSTLTSDATPATYGGGFVFATTFYILFFLINIAHNIKENQKFIASDFGILLVNTCLYFAAGLYLLSEMNLASYRGLFSASMGVLNLLTSYILFRKRKVDSNILYLLIGITLTFISLTAPIQLHGHYITLFWASESVLLCWLHQKSRIRIIGLASILIWAAMLISLLMDWSELYFGYFFNDRSNGHNLLPIVFNKGFITGLYAGLCCYAVFLLHRGTDKGQRVLPRTPFLATGSLILLAGGALEIDYQLGYYYPGSHLNILYLLLYTFSFVSLITLLTGRMKWVRSYQAIAGVLAAGVVLYILFIPEAFEIQKSMLEQDRYGGHFIAHWISALLVATMLYRLTGLQRAGKGVSDDMTGDVSDGATGGMIRGAAGGVISSVIDWGVFTWIMGGMIVLFLSAEIQLLVNTFFYSKTNSLEEIQRVYFKTGLPILWGLCSFAFMWLGMRHKFKPLRILSLTLFLLTLLKLFLFDIQDIPIAGKIAAFFCLGVLLLVVSFMYQRLKKIIIEDEEKKTV